MQARRSDSRSPCAVALALPASGPAGGRRQLRAPTSPRARPAFDSDFARRGGLLHPRRCCAIRATSSLMENALHGLYRARRLRPRRADRAARCCSRAPTARSRNRTMLTDAAKRGRLAADRRRHRRRTDGRTAVRRAGPRLGLCRAGPDGRGAGGLRRRGRRPGGRGLRALPQGAGAGRGGRFRRRRRDPCRCRRGRAAAADPARRHRPCRRSSRQLGRGRRRDRR